MGPAGVKVYSACEITANKVNVQNVLAGDLYDLACYLLAPPTVLAGEWCKFASRLGTVCCISFYANDLLARPAILGVLLPNNSLSHTVAVAAHSNATHC